MTECPIMSFDVVIVHTNLRFDAKPLSRISMETLNSFATDPVCLDCSQGTSIFTPPRNRGGVIFLLQFVCLCVCV